MAFEHIGALWSLLIQFNPFAANLFLFFRLPNRDSDDLTHSESILCTFRMMIWARMGGLRLNQHVGQIYALRTSQVHDKTRTPILPPACDKGPKY